MDSSIWKVNFLVLCVGIALVISLTKLSSLLAPYDWYFSFSELLFAVPYPPTWASIIIKFAIPVIGGLFVGFFASENPKGTAGAVGFSSAFILAWPAINDWTLYITDEVLVGREYAFKIVYVLYFIAYTHLSIAGARLMSIYLNFAAQQGQTRTTIISDVLDWKNSVKPAMIGVVSSVASFVLNKVFSQ
jgi:hypothetical protein